MGIRIWLVVTGTMDFFWLSNTIGNVIIPTDELICFRGVETTNQYMNVIGIQWYVCMYIYIYVCVWLLYIYVFWYMLFFWIYWHIVSMVLFMSGFQYILGYTPMMVKPSIFQLSRLSFFKGCIQCIVYIYIYMWHWTCCWNQSWAPRKRRG